MLHHDQRNNVYRGATTHTNAVIHLHAVYKQYESAGRNFTALNNVNLQIDAGEFVTIVGRSGSGKSTLINMITGIDRPTTGEIYVAGAALHGFTEAQMARWRGRNVGVVFQFFQLLPTLTVIENVMLPMDVCNTQPPRTRRHQAWALLERMGIAEQADKLPTTLSGGQQQRAAIARALANDPPLLVADEPTGNLDSQTTTAVFALFQSLVSEGKTVVMVTHERDFAHWSTKQIKLSDGVIVADDTPTSRAVESALPLVTTQVVNYA